MCTVKAPLNPEGAYLILDLPGGGTLKREGGLFTKSSDKDIFDSFSVFYPIFCGLNRVLRYMH